VRNPDLGAPTLLALPRACSGTRSPKTKATPERTLFQIYARNRGSIEGLRNYVTVRQIEARRHRRRQGFLGRNSAHWDRRECGASHVPARDNHSDCAPEPVRSGTLFPSRSNSWLVPWLRRSIQAVLMDNAFLPIISIKCPFAAILPARHFDYLGQREARMLTD